MGGVCAGGVMNHKMEFQQQKLSSSSSSSSGHSTKLLNKHKSFENKQRTDQISDSHLDSHLDVTVDMGLGYYNKFDLHLPFSSELKPSTPARTGLTSKVPQMSSILGRAGIVGLEVLDTLGSSITNLNPTTGFVYGVASRGSKISILSFEVANTIVKGSNLLQSLSEESVQILKQVTLHSDGVTKLVSTDMEQLLRIAAADKREEFDVFSREVVRFGDLCKDPQWHNLGRYFQKLESDFTADVQRKEEAEMTMQELLNLAQHTSELYHELPPLDRLEQDYQRKLEELQSLNLPRRGESVTILHGELKHQRKHVRSLKKRSLWSKNLDEVVEKLVDIVTFIHQEISELFSNYDMKDPKFGCSEQSHNPPRLGPSGLALHYANIINQIDSIVSRPSFLPANMRDNLYQGLPTSVKAALRSRLQKVQEKEELTVQQIKAEMGKTLHWLAPVAANTTKAHQGFGWVGEWANTGNDFNTKTSRQNNLMRIQTLYHAEKEKTEMYILELVTWLHRLVSQVRNRDQGFKPVIPIQSHQKDVVSLAETKDPSCEAHNGRSVRLTEDDQEMLKDVSFRRLVPGISKSQEFATNKKKRTVKKLGLSRSSGSSPSREFSRTNTREQRSSNILDVMDGLDPSD